MVEAGNSRTSMTRRISILGSTGSIGKNALDVVRRHGDFFKVEALAARGNTELLLQQINEFQPACVAVYDDAAAIRLQAAGVACRVVAGAAGLDEAASLPVDVVLCAVVGAVGLMPLLTAIDAGNRVAVANKEPLVMAGRHVMETARRRGVEVLPVDSEHNAVFQCLQSGPIEQVRCVHLTASGGPFYRCTREQLLHITPQQAATHPTWSMGRKISVDSATLMNKGLEIIEALCLFGLRSEQIEVVIHPQSTVHSLVEYVDGGMIAHLGVTDMRIPIAHAMSYPDRLSAPEMRLDLTSLAGLTFDKPDAAAFPCLALARAAAEAGGCAPAILNAANEAAVEAFCEGRIAFLQIADVVAATLDGVAAKASDSLDCVLEADRAARHYALAHITTLEPPTT